MARDQPADALNRGVRASFLLLFGLALALLVSGLIVPAPAAAFELGLPIRCELGKTCFIQNYVDVDAGPGRSDFSCRRATYDGHKGTDFRLVSTLAAAKGVHVLAAGAGVVLRRRDGMADLLYKAQDAPLLKGRECGNGMVIKHKDGWQTQYCHMKRGSIRVRAGQQVKRGTVLGNVGYSGKAAFAHLHLTLRHNGRVIDPFTGKAVGKALNCNLAKPRKHLDRRDRPGRPDRRDRPRRPRSVQTGSMWSAGSNLRRHRPASRIIETRFIGALLKGVPPEAGFSSVASVHQRSKVLVFAARLINLSKGDRLQLIMRGPKGFSINSIARPLKKNKATYRIIAGKQRKAAPWPKGLYHGRIAIIRQGKAISSMARQFNLK